MSYYKLHQLQDLSDVLLDQEVEQLTTAATASPTTYGLTSGLALEMASAYSQYNVAYQALLAADTEYRKAVQDKISQRDALLIKLNEILPMCYANKDVTNNELAALGLAPRVPRGGLTPLYAPIELTVTPVANNSAVKLKWKRNGNSTSTIYVIEKQVEDGAWEIVWTGGRTKTELGNTPAGVEASFRVYATKADENSNFSNEVTIYRPGGAGALRVAA